MGLFLGFPSFPVVYISAFVPMPHSLMTVALQYNLKSGRLILPAPFFFLKTALAIRGLLCFRMNCEIFCSSSVKNASGNLVGVTLNLQIAFGSIVYHFHNIASSYPGTWNLSPSVYVIFDFLHQCLIIFSVQFWFSLIDNSLSMFRLPDPCCETSLSPGSLAHLSSLRVT